MKAKAIQFHQCGKPSEVLVLEEVELPTLREGEVLVKMDAATMNPADFNYIVGNYGVDAQLPGVPGIEGTGVVMESRADAVAVGVRVIFVERVGTWQEYVVCPASVVIVLEQEVDVLQAAMLKVNPLTARCLLDQFVALGAGDWVLQNAANSSVGQCVIQLAKAMGVGTLNVVRREGLEQSLHTLGAEHVLVDGAGMVQQVRDICGKQLPKLGSNAVGGDAALRMMDALAEGGTMVTYGAMSRRSLKVPNSFLIFKNISLRGLWVTKWLEHASRAEVEGAYGALAEQVAEGALLQAVERVYAVEDYGSAVQRAQESGRSGKILLKF